MDVIIVGAGEVGSNIAVSLSETHEVTVIDTDPEKVDQLTYTGSILAIEGDGTELDVLEEAGIAAADMLIASTDDDEINLAVCGTANTVSEAFTIARVRKPNYVHTWNRSEGAFGVDFIVSTTLLTADDIVRVVGLPAAIDVDPFVGGLVQMAEFEVPEESPIAGKTVEDADEFDALTFAGIVKNGTVSIARGQTVIDGGNKVIVIGKPDSVQAFSRSVTSAKKSRESRDIVVVGGGDIARQTAKVLEERNIKPRLIEEDQARSRELAEALPDTVVLNNDATDIDFLQGEHIDRTDALIAATNSDETNLLVALLAKTIGVPRTVAVVEYGEYKELFEAVGIDVVINPREATAEEIIRFTQDGQIENLSLIEGRQAEIIEIEVDAGSILVGRPIRESAAELPDEVVIGAITRGHEYVIPRGETVIQSGDHVVLFVAEAVVDAVLERV